MQMGFLILAGITALGALAFWHKMKIWSVTLIGFNLMLATLFAIGLFEKVANMIDGALPITAFYNDMIAFAVIFVLILALLMFITSSISKIDIRFLDKTDNIAKWIASLLIVFAFSGITIFVFYQTMPEKPKQPVVFITMKIVDFVSGGSLSPLIGSDKWDSGRFVQDQIKRDSGVYKQTVDNGASGWKFEGDSSPNAE